MAEADREKALQNAMAQIERAHGKGSIMRMGERGHVPVEVIPTGAISLDIALGIGGLPRGRIVEIYGPESSGKTTVALHAVANAQALGGIAAFIDAEHALDPEYAQKLGVDTDALLVSQPDSGEQALEIADTLIRSGALDIIVIDSVAALVPRAEIEGEMGDSHVGLQARLMSQALRKITGALSSSGTTAIFINQLREKIGVMFGCLSGSTRVQLADGTTEKIGKIVNEKLPVEVLSYDPASNRIVPRKVVNWFNNGVAERFLQFTVEKSGGNGRAQFAATENHLIRTPGGWREAGELIAGDRVMASELHRLSDQQWQVVLGSLLGDGNLSSNLRGRNGVRFRLGHGVKQLDYLDWKVSLLGNIGVSRRTNAKSAVFADFTPLPELGELQRTVYLGDGKKTITEEYLKALTPLALAIWFMDDGSFTLRSEGLQGRTRGGSGRVQFCVEAMSPGSRERLVSYLRDTWGLDMSLRFAGTAGKATLTFTTAASAAFLELVTPFVHPSMDYKLLPGLRGRFAVEPEFVEPASRLVPTRILDIHVKPPTRSMHKFDLEVEGHHNYFVDGVMVHNSPETTTGGRALKFYSSVRLDVRRIESLKDGTDFVGNRTRIKVAKNKCLAEGTMVFDPVTGITHRIEEIVDRRLPVHVVASDKTGRLEARAVNSWFDQGTQDVIGLDIGAGQPLWVTPDHKVMTESGWQRADQLVAGDRVARPRSFLSFGNAEPVTPDQARQLGYLIGNGYDGGIPASFFGSDVSATVMANLVFGLFETDGWVSREQTGAIRVGYATTSEQLAHQLHWALLRWGIGSTVRRREPHAQRGGLIKSRRIVGKLPCWEVRVAGIENVQAFADAIPMWGPRGHALVEALGAVDGKHRGSQRIYLSPRDTEAILAHLTARGVMPELVADILGKSRTQARAGLRQLLCSRRHLRRDRVQSVADALDDDFLHNVLADGLCYVRIKHVLPARSARTFDVEVDEFHNLVAEDVLVHNCAPPFKQAEFDIMYGQGISREGGLIDVGVDTGLVRKAGAWYTYEGDQLGQGKENARNFLRDNPDLANELEKKILEKLGIGATIDENAPIDVEPVDIDF
jgi:recombination protein RecA